MKKPNGLGTVIKLSGNRRKPYAAVVTMGWVQNYDDNGYPKGNPKQQRKYIGYYEKRRDAILALNEYAKSHDNDSNSVQLVEGKATKESNQEKTLSSETKKVTDMKEDFSIKLGDKMRKAREQRGYSLRNMGKLLGMNYSALSYWETGRTDVSVRQLKRYCDVLDISYLDLLKKVSSL